MWTLKPETPRKKALHLIAGAEILDKNRLQSGQASRSHESRGGIEMHIKEPQVHKSRQSWAIRDLLQRELIWIGEKPQLEASELRDVRRIEKTFEVAGAVNFKPNMLNRFKPV
jgi:hypothetical protein